MEETLGRRIKRLREKKKLSMAELATRSGVSQGQISNYESDKQLPGLKTAVGIAGTLKVSLSYLALGKEMSQLEAMVPLVEGLPKTRKTKILNFIKDQIIQDAAEVTKKRVSKELK